MNKYGENLKIDDEVVFETTLMNHCGIIEPTIDVLKVYDSGSSCRVGFICSTEYGGMDIFTE